MPFPNSPSNGQLATVNNLVYVYNSTKGVWNKANVAAPLVTNSISIPGDITTTGNLNVTGRAVLGFGTTSNVVVAANTTSISATTGALIVTGGTGITGNAVVSGTMAIGATPADAKLDVVSSGLIARLASSTTSGYALQQFGRSATASQNWHIGSEGDGTFRLYNGNFGAGTERVRVDSGGNLQVATTTGSERITVGSAGNIRLQSSSKVRIEYLNTGGAYVLGTTGGAAVVFDTVSGVHQEIAFETHNSGNYHREHMRIDKDGKVTQPYQPAFYANGPSSNQTLGNGGNLVMSNAIYNIGSHYNTSTYRFTAPVAGRYLFTWSVFVNSATGRCAIKVNGGGYNDLQMDAGAGLSQSAVISLNANDFVTVGDWQNISGLQYWGSHSHFSGVLLG
jgi:hypothetical protein